MRKRNHPVFARLSDFEYQELMKRVNQSGQTLQSFIINATLAAKISSIDEVLELKRFSSLLEDMDKQLRGIGTNLNQLAHVANAQGNIPTMNELTVLASSITEMRNEVNNQWRYVRQLINQSANVQRL